MKKKISTTLAIVAASLTPLLARGDNFQDGVSTAKSKSNLPDKKIEEVLTSVMEWLASILAIVGVIGFLVSGIIYITSAGNEDRMELAKRGMVYSIIGLVVGLLGYAIVRTLNSVLGGTSSGGGSGRGGTNPGIWS